MKALVVYSSRTGNTRKIAEAIAAVLPGCEIHPVESAPAPEGYDLVAVGYWVDKGMPDAQAKAYLETVRDAKVALFGTLGAWPDSDHARDCIAQGEALVNAPERRNKVLGTYLCQGKVDPKIVAMMQKMASDVHPMTPERKAAILARMPVHAFGDTKDLGAMAKFLLGDGATYITGQDFAVDGGALAYGF